MTVEERLDKLESTLNVYRYLVLGLTVVIVVLAVFTFRDEDTIRCKRLEVVDITGNTRTLVAPSYIATYDLIGNKRVEIMELDMGAGIKLYNKENVYQMSLDVSEQGPYMA